MPEPRQTGQFREVGASSPGFVRALTDSDLAGALDALARDTLARKQTHAGAAFKALLGSDPILYPVASTVRPRVTAMLRRHATELAKVRADPRRRFLNRQGIEAEEAGLRAVQEREFAALEAEVTQKLAQITDSLSAKLVTLRGKSVSLDDAAEASAMAARLRNLTPELALGELVEVFYQIGDGERPRGQAIALLPVLESAYRTPGSPWTGRDELRRLVSIGESLCDGGWEGAVIASRLERAQRLAGDINTFLFLARTDPTSTALNAHITGGADPELDQRFHGAPSRAHGEFALLPEQPAPLGPAVEQATDWRDAPTGAFRRVSVSPQQRAADEAARAVQVDQP
jgi:hypothetical protein